jgi:exodeoxyribonuclease-3
MEIVSWNVNGIRSVEKKGFLNFVGAETPDILCIQETKAEPGQLAPALKEPCDKNGTPYHSWWASAKKRGYSGVAIYAKTEPRTVTPLGNPLFDDEGRVLQADFGKFVLICAYFPNSQEGGARLDYKLSFCDEMMRLCKKLETEGRHFILCGDYNIAHKPVDLARPAANEENPGYLPEERAWMDNFTSAGFVDTFRHFHGDKEGQYSWWSYRAASRERNVGWRIDYHCVDAAFLPNVKNARIRPDIRGSDHCPVSINLEI